MIAPPQENAPLRKRAVKGGAWTVGGLVVQNVLRLGSNLLMTRLLVPEAFGLMALVSAINFWLVMMSDLGLQPTILRSKNPTDPVFFSTIWWVQVMRNGLIALGLIGIGLALGPMRGAGLINAESVFGDPRLPFFIFGAALMMLIQGVSAMRSPLYQRNLDMGPLIRIELTTQIMGIAAMVLLALNGAGPYSLLGGSLTTSIGNTIASYTFLKGPRVQFIFDRTHFNEIFGFGKWILISSTGGAIIAKGDHLIFGWLFDIRSFSLYAIAAIWIGAAILLVQTLLNKVFMSVFSEIHRDRPQDMQSVYKKIRLTLEIGAVGLFLGAQLFADLGVRILYEPEYADVATYIKLLSVSLLFLPSRALHLVVLSSGDSRRFMFATIIPGVILLAGTPTIYHHLGASPAIIFTACVYLFSMPYNWHAAKKYMAIEYPREMVQMIIAAAAAAWLLAIY